MAGASLKAPHGKPWWAALAPLLGLASLIAAWQVLVLWTDAPAAVLPAPRSVGAVLWVGLWDGRFRADLQFTLAGILGGLSAGAALGLVVGLATGSSARLHAHLYGVLVAVQSMPLVAIAPLLIAWLGIGLASKVVLVAMSAFFPVFMGTVAGMRAADPGLLDLYAAAGAPRWRVALDVQLPAAAGFVFAGLQVAAVGSVIACVVSEMLASPRGLGFQIRALSGALDTAAMFALVVLLASVGAVLSLALGWLEQRVVFWKGN
jgi:NitT/TauT family transport system permease protein